MGSPASQKRQGNAPASPPGPATPTRGPVSMRRRASATPGPVGAVAFVVDMGLFNLLMFGLPIAIAVVLILLGGAQSGLLSQISTN